MRALDLTQVIAKRIEDAGLGKAYTKQPNAKKVSESIVVILGAPTRENFYFDGSRDVIQMVSVYVKRREEDAAASIADKVGDVLREADLTSENGSYELTSAITFTAHPFAFDPSGFFIWAIEAEISMTRKD